MKKVFIIAEAGLNFKGSARKAIEYCTAAKEIGADAIKFQIIDCESGASDQKLKDCELKLWEWKAIKLYCDKIGIEFMATPSSINKLNYLQNELHVKKIKIGSDRANNNELIQTAINGSDTVIVSTGAYDINNDVVKMFCTSLYPTKLEWVNFDYLTDDYKGWSDHTLEYGQDIVNILDKYNLEYYEKHFKLYDNENCIDRHCSITKDQFAELIKLIRQRENFMENYAELEKTYG